MRTTGYKLTDQQMQTHNGFQWVLGETRKTSGKGNLCSPGWLHYYEHPLLAVLHNPIHAYFRAPRLFGAEVCGKVKTDEQMKSGCTSLTLIKELTLPVLTMEQRIRYAIGCALAVCEEPTFIWWAEYWLSGKNRSERAARAAVAEARAAWAVSTRVTRAARARAAAAEAAVAEAEEEEEEAWAVEEAVAAEAAGAAEEAAWAAAAEAAEAEEAAVVRIDLIAIAEWAMTDNVKPL